jgi:hypothetical protein
MTELQGLLGMKVNMSDAKPPTVKGVWRSQIDMGKIELEHQPQLEANDPMFAAPMMHQKGLAGMC